MLMRHEKSSDACRKTLSARRYFSVKEGLCVIHAVFHTAECVYGLMVWDAQSTGTLSNVIELLRQNKYSAVFVNKLKRFELIKTPSDLKKLISYMSPAALEKAEQKIKLSQKLDKLDNSQMQMALLYKRFYSLFFIRD